MNYESVAKKKYLKSIEHTIEKLINRSQCSVQAAAVICEARNDVIATGWNGPGADGMGQHAEAHAILRANKKRLRGATIYVASVRGRNGKIIISKPCIDCQKLINKWGLRVVWRNHTGEWVYEVY